MSGEDAGDANFAFTEADEGVWAMLLAESSSLDPLLDPAYWSECERFDNEGDLNFNPDWV